MRLRLPVLLVTVLLTQVVKAQNLTYYLPANTTYHSSVPTPASVIGHEVGEWHVTHDKLVQYIKALNVAAPTQSVLQNLGTTYEGRQQLALIISSPKNIARLEEIRTQHLAFSKKGTTPSQKLPVIVWMGFSIHGNESSGSNASMLTAYHLLAANDAALKNMLENTIVIIDPSFNPDGLNRFASWVNSHKNTGVLNPDPQSREYNEVWPGGRFNHYWFDLNRDWLPAQHVESKNRLALYQQWLPHILTDHHEQGSNATYFFQPGVPSRTNPNTPPQNQQLTAEIATYHAKKLDSIKTLYFTKEGYDDFYYGKGSTYPDINGGIGILFEQASSRGHLQETENGLLSFPFTIKNQFITTLSTLEAASKMQEKLTSYQRVFFEQAQKEAAEYPTKSFVFGSTQTQEETRLFIELLHRHDIDVYPITKNIQLDGKTFLAGSSYSVPTNQVQFKLIKTIFEKNTQYKDSLFYDVTAWTLPLAFGIPYAASPVSQTAGTKIAALMPANGNLLNAENAVSYAFSWQHLQAPKLLYQLQKMGIVTKVATQLFTAISGNQAIQFGYGSIVITPQANQRLVNQLPEILQKAAKQTGVNIYGIQTGLALQGVDLGSGSLLNVKTPKIAVATGSGVAATDVGEIWHLLDARLQIPITHLDWDRWGSANLAKYNVLIIPSGNYSSTPARTVEALKTWVQNGGTLVVAEDAAKWAAQNGLTKVLFKPETEKKDSTANLPYFLRADEQRAREMTGSIFEATADTTHPIAYGVPAASISVFKGNTFFMDQNNDAYDSPVMYTANPLQSGYVYREYLGKIKNAAVINVDALGRGRVISFADNMNFRAFWLGSSKLFINAIYFGDLVRL